MRDAVRKYPARPLTPGERSLLEEWVAAAGDIALAYVSSRGSDDASLRHKIVIIADSGKEPSHFIHAPFGRNIWMVISAGRRTKIQRFRSLRDALSSVRPVLSDETPPVPVVRVDPD